LECDEQASAASEDDVDAETAPFESDPPGPSAAAASPLSLLPPGALLIRAAFDEAGALRWWAIPGSSAGGRLLARGAGRPGGRARLQWAVRLFDLDVELVWAAFARSASDYAIDAAAWAALADLDARARAPAARRAAMASAAPVSWLQAATSALNLLRRTGRSALADAGSALLADLEGRVALLDDVSDVLRARFSAAVETLGPAGAATPKVTRRDHLMAALDAATERQVASLRAEFDLRPLERLDPPPAPWDQTDVVFRVQGPLYALPLGWLGFGGTELHRRVASISTAVSVPLSFSSTAAGAEPHRSNRRLVAASHLPRTDWRRGMRGLAWMHAGLRRAAAAHRWEMTEFGDAPAATVAEVEGLCADPAAAPRVLVIGGHGSSRSASVRLADGDWRGDRAPLAGPDWLVLAACAVGRLTEDAQNDAEGLYTACAKSGARSVLAARWPVADAETAALVCAAVSEYLADADAPFPRARALNRARRLADHPLAAYRVSRHVLSAFDVLGLG
jgi:hypothetical protein